MKKLIGISVFLSILFILISGAYVWYELIPHDQVEKLKQGYIKVEVKDNKPIYTFTNKRPANWVSLKQINPKAYQAIMVSEDWAFYEHEGVDWSQVSKALKDSINENKKLRGASTISQQLVKNLFLTHDYSFIRKLKEAVITTYVERELTKDQILEAYLNVIEYGEGLYGIKGASNHYFSKSPKNLNAKEGAFLAMLLPNPKRYSQSHKEGKMSEFASNTVSEVLTKMKIAKFLTEEELNKALNQRYNWEGRKERVPNFKDSSSKGRNRKVARAKRDGSSVEYSFRNDSALEIEDNPSFDDDAIVEDVAGLEEEFRIE